jgi:hypothetical protein
LSKALDKRFLDFKHVRWWLLKALCCENDLPHRQVSWNPHGHHSDDCGIVFDLITGKDKNPKWLQREIEASDKTGV